MKEIVTDELKAKIYELFEQHDKIVEEQDEYIEQLRERNKHIQSEITRLKAERDKAVEHIEQIMKYCDNRACKICKRRPKRNDIHCIECSPKYSGLEEDCNG